MFASRRRPFDLVARLYVLGTLTAVVSLCSTRPSSADLVTAWDFDEGSGTIVHDRTSKGHDGITQRSFAFSSDTPSGNGYSGKFNGEGYLRVADADDLDPLADFTFAAWVKTTVANAGFILHKHVPGTNQDGSWYWGASPVGDNKSSQWFIATPWNGELYANLEYPINEWHHIAMTYVNESKAYTFYLDGQAVDSGKYEANILNNTNDLGVGGVASENGGYMFHGLIDDLRLYDGALSDSGIRDLLKPRSPGDTDCDGVVSFNDIDPFVLALIDRTAYETAYPDCNYFNADLDINDAVDFDDIDPLVGRLAQSLDFNDPAAYAVRKTPHCVRTGDFDGDGDQDLVVANLDQGPVSVLMNNGDGTFGEQRDGVLGRSHGVCVADFDEDGNLDIAGTQFFDDTVCVVLGDGTGNFGDSRCLGTADQPFAVEAADFDQDGHVDLAVTCELANKTVILFNDGTANFSRRADLAVGGRPRLFAVGDVNGDGYIDIVAACYASNEASVLLNNGDGSFAKARSLEVTGGPQCPKLVDVDNDGDLDLVLATPDSVDIAVFQNSGAGEYGSATRYSIGTASAVLCVSDLNLDGYPDIACTSGKTISILLNHAGAFFDETKSWPANQGTSYIWTADIDRDGDFDVIVTNRDTAQVSVLINAFIP